MGSLIGCLCLSLPKHLKQLAKIWNMLSRCTSSRITISMCLILRFTRDLTSYDVIRMNFKQEAPHLAIFRVYLKS